MASLIITPLGERVRGHFILLILPQFMSFCWINPLSNALAHYKATDDFRKK